MLASVIIPSHNRNELVLRAYSSVLQQNGASEAEVIIVDDGSSPPLRIENLRPQDKIVRLQKNSGGAVARNAGLDIATGELIYFLDSDDCFVRRDYFADRNFIGESSDLFYCSSTANGVPIKSPEYVDGTTYFKSIFCIFPGVANTCSMVFRNKKNLRFDPTMPKHQDWEFVYSNFISKGLNLIKIDGVIDIDRSDKNSTSRKRSYERSLPWLMKLKNDVDKETFVMVEFHLLGDYTNYMSWPLFIKTATKLILNKKTTMFVIGKKIAQRILL